MSQVLKGEHGRHRQEGILDRGKSTCMGGEVRADAECARHYQLGVITGQRRGAGGVRGSPIPTHPTWETPAAVWTVLMLG